MQLVTDGLGIPESTRWHDGRAWVCNWGAGEVLAVTPAGATDVVARLAPETLPLSVDFLPDGRMLIVDGPRRLLLRHEAGGVLTQIAELGAHLGDGQANELVIDADGNAYVNGGAGRIVHVTPDGEVATVAEGLAFANGMTLLDGGRTLVVADSRAVALIAYAVRADGTLGDASTWAQLKHAPDGICADADGAVWAASVPGRSCVRVRAGGEVLNTVELDRGCFACTLGGEDGRTLFIAAAHWRGMDALYRDGPGRTGQLLAAPGQPASHAGRP